ncbi:MAG: hypothetical protein J1E40_09660 [Oscillospiraceae bacterium]|nr:hypothetical protein [Oscillospiraceae bacterium]
MSRSRDDTCGITVSVIYGIVIKGISSSVVEHDTMQNRMISFIVELHS